MMIHKGTTGPMNLLLSLQYSRCVMFLIASRTYDYDEVQTS